MGRRLLAGLLLTWLAAAPCAAGFGALHPREVLAYWQGPMSEDIRLALREDLLPALTAAERARLGAVRLAFPLTCPEPGLCAGGTDPFTFLAGRDGAGTGHIVLSIASLRLWGDLALAWAWLQVNGRAIDTPAHYVTMLKYRPAREFPGGRYPRPLQALGIPEAEARADPEVMDLFSHLFAGGVYFLLAHELAHLVHGHPGYGPDVPREQARSNEAQADRFALDLLARVGQPPGGAVFLLTAWAHGAPGPWDFASEAAYRHHLAAMTHPLEARRLAELAVALEQRAGSFARKQWDPAASRAAMTAAAGDVRRLAEFLEDRDLQQALALLGRSMDPVALQPRAAGDPIPLPPPDDVRPGDPFHRACAGRMSDASGSLALRMQLRRRDEVVSGVFSVGLGLGRLDGRLVGERLEFRWHHAGASGAGTLAADESGALAGTWGQGGSTDGSGRLTCGKP